MTLIPSGPSADVSSIRFAVLRSCDLESVGASGSIFRGLRFAGAAASGWSAWSRSTTLESKGSYYGAVRRAFTALPKYPLAAK